MICSLNREQITETDPRGYDAHVKGEHNYWNYLKYMASLY